MASLDYMAGKGATLERLVMGLTSTLTVSN